MNCNTNSFRPQPLTIKTWLFPSWTIELYTTKGQFVLIKINQVILQ